MLQAHLLRTVILAWSLRCRGRRPVPNTVDPPDWRPAAWSAKLTLHLPGLVRDCLRQDRAAHLTQLQ
eukprot:12824691-Alexandrium_andersonii.AAC.1